LADCLRKMALAGSTGVEKQRIFALVHERSSGQLESEAPTRLRIEGAVEVIARAVGIAEAGLFAAAFQQAIGGTREFIRDQARDQVDGSHGFGLSLAQTGFEHCGHASRPQSAERAFEFDDVYDWFCWRARFSMRSRCSVS